MKMPLVLALSSLGLLVAVFSILGHLQSGLETAASALIAVVCSLVLARRAPGRFFLHGFLTGLISGALVTLTQAAFMSVYLAHNPKAAEAFKALPVNIAPALLVVATIPFSAGLNGAVTGLLTWLAAKFMRPGPVATSG